MLTRVPFMAASAAALLGTTVAAPSASAAPPEEKWHHESVVEVDDHFCDDPATPEVNEGLTVEIVTDLLVRETVRRPGRDGLVHFAANVRGTIEFTNLETGEGLLQTLRVNDRDVRVVDNGDGTLSIRFVSSGRVLNEFSNGVTYLDAGAFVAQAVIDHAGTPGDPEDDEFLSDTVRFAGHWDTADRDFCADFVEFTT